ncbi:hypothetical protein ACRCUN_10420 [Mycobacterium sp. LTG2003]
MRNTAIGCAIACGAMVAGPGVAGTAVASADLFGIDIDILDIFDHKDKNKKKSDRGPKVGAQQNGGSKKAGGLGPAGPKRAPRPEPGGVSQSAATADRAPESANAPGSVTFRGAGQSPPAAVSGGGGGGGGVPTNSNIGRAPNLAPVPTTPSSRGIVVRAAPPATPAVPAAPVAPVVPVPIVVPPVPIALPALPAAPSGGGAPSAPAAPSPDAPKFEPPSAPPPAANPSAPQAVPESFRIGYADYLRAASTSDLLFAVLPGVAGLTLLTAAGGAIGFRQARAAQTLPSPQIARFLP